MGAPDSCQLLPLTNTLAPPGVRGETLGAAAAVAPRLVLTAMLAEIEPGTLVHVFKTERDGTKMAA